MEKYILTIEFRYWNAPKNQNNFTSQTKKITIGVYDNLDHACFNGNILLEKLERKFDIHTFLNGTKSKQHRFSKNSECSENKNILITNLGYLKTPFDFCAKIEILRYDLIDELIDEIVDSVKRHEIYKSTLPD